MTDTLFPAIEAPLAPAAAPQTFASEADRARLSDVAVKAFKRISASWRLTNPQSAALLGVSQSTWDRIKRGDRHELLSQDQLTRVSAIVGIFKGLELIFADDMPNRWPNLPNKGPIFNGSTPVDAMMSGGIPVMLEVRRHIDAVRGGL